MAAVLRDGGCLIVTDASLTLRLQGQDMEHLETLPPDHESIPPLPDEPFVEPNGNVATTVAEPSAAQQWEVDPVKSTAVPVAPAKVVHAPVVHGRSFVLRYNYDQKTRSGQMLVLMDKQQRHAPMEVVHMYLPPLSGGRPVGRGSERFYLGDIKLGSRFLAGILEMKISSAPEVAPMEYRILYPSGKPLKEWQPMDLSILRIKTTEEQRALISVFTGILYKIQDRAPKTREQHRQQASDRALGGVFDRAGVTVKDVSKQLAKQSK